MGLDKQVGRTVAQVSPSLKKLLNRKDILPASVVEAEQTG
jgi:hypothetical protein